MFEVKVAPWWYSLISGEVLTLKTGHRCEVLGFDTGIIQVLREDGIVQDVSPEDIRR